MVLRQLFVEKETDPTRAKRFINSGRNDVWAFKGLGVCIAIRGMYTDTDHYKEQLRKHKISLISKERFTGCDWWGADEGDHLRFDIETGSIFKKTFKYEVWITDWSAALGPISESEEGRIYRRITISCNGKECIQTSVSQWMDNIHWDLELIDFCIYETDWNTPLQAISESDPLFF